MSGTTMAESQIENLGLGHLIPNPISNFETHNSKSEPSQNAHDDEDLEFLQIIERGIYELMVKQAEIEGLKEAVDVNTCDDEEEPSEKHDLGDETSGDVVDAEVENEESVRGYFGDIGLQRNGNQRWSKFPMRPDAEDCAFYMKTGSCKFGSSCKFNHPPRRKNQFSKEWTNWRGESSERGAAGECKYYSTPGGCKYGNDCKYSHGSDKNPPSQVQELNFTGLPIRPGEKECPYYMRTGSCKYGSTCRFHHPDPTAVSGSENISANGNDNNSVQSQHISSSTNSSWSHPQVYGETSPYVAPIPSQSFSTSGRKGNGYQVGTYQTSERGLPLPPAFSITKLPAGINLGFQHQHNNNLLVDEFPERPGEPECNYFMKTGQCKFKSSCKFHHPKPRLSNPKASSFSLNDKGLPLRPDQPICTHYHRYGICKFGPGCKYDHPSSYPPPPSFGTTPENTLMGLRS